MWRAGFYSPEGFCPARTGFWPDKSRRGLFTVRPQPLHMLSEIAYVLPPGLVTIGTFLYIHLGLRGRLRVHAFITHMEPLNRQLET